MKLQQIVALMNELDQADLLAIQAGSNRVPFLQRSVMSSYQIRSKGGIRK